MKLTVLGSGSTVPDPQRTSSGYWVESGESRILLDCSASVPSRMASERVAWPELDAVWISHFHIDHCAGIMPLLAATKHASETRDRKKPLRIFGPPGLKTVLSNMDAVHNYRLFEQPFPVAIKEIDDSEPFEMAPGFEAVSMKTPHTKESRAIHLRDDDGKTLVYSADTGFGEPIAAFANLVDLFILECTFIRDKPIKKHLELSEAMFLIRKARPKLAMLTHLYPEWNDVDLDALVKGFDPPCRVIEARDGLELEF
jgi:ribonuclease BN (tRNA processing enzyme)